MSRRRPGGVLTRAEMSGKTRISRSPFDLPSTHLQLNERTSLLHAARCTFLPRHSCESPISSFLSFSTRPYTFPPVNTRSAIGLPSLQPWNKCAVQSLTAVQPASIQAWQRLLSTSIVLSYNLHAVTLFNRAHVIAVCPSHR